MTQRLPASSCRQCPHPPRKKCPEVPTLANYILKRKVAAMTGKWTRHQMARGARAIRNLEEGAKAFQKRPLPALSVPNAESAYTHRELITDRLATWVKASILAGPFMPPPPATLHSRLTASVQ